MRGRLAAAALVEQKHVVERRIEQPALVGVDAAARSAMQEDGGLRALRADPFPGDHVAVADLERPGLIGFDFRIERTQNFGHRCSPFAGQFSVS